MTVFILSAALAGALISAALMWIKDRTREAAKEISEKAAADIFARAEEQKHDLDKTPPPRTEEEIRRELQSRTARGRNLP